jgi:hypothetical protein
MGTSIHSGYLVSQLLVRLKETDGEAAETLISRQARSPPGNHKTSGWCGSNLRKFFAEYRLAFGSGEVRFRNPRRGTRSDDDFVSVVPTDYVSLAKAGGNRTGAPCSPNTSPHTLLPASFSERVRTSHRKPSKSAEARNKIAIIGRRCVATGIATLAPVHKVRYAARHSGHFGSRTSSAPEPTHPLVPCHHRRPIWTLQQLIVSGFRSLFELMENMSHP